jgi:hypothetical protein
MLRQHKDKNNRVQPTFIIESNSPKVKEGLSESPEKINTGTLETSEEREVEVK